MRKTRILEGEREMLSVVDVGRILGLTQTVVRQLCREEKIPSVKIGRRIYIPRAELERQIESDMRGTVTAMTPNDNIPCPKCGGAKQYCDKSFASDWSYAKFHWTCDDCNESGVDLFSLDYFDTDLDEE